MSWRLNIIAEFVQAFERGDVAALDRLLSPNFREAMEDLPDICRFQYLDAMQTLFAVTRIRSMQINTLAFPDDEVQASITARYVSEKMDWAIDCGVRLVFDGRLIDRLVMSDRTVRYFRPWQGADVPASELEPGDSPASLENHS